MSRFYITVDRDTRKLVTAGASKKMLIHAGGWNVGVSITLTTDENGKDVVYVSKTGGSNNPVTSEPTVVYKED